VVAARGGRVCYCSHGSAFGSHQLEIVPGDGTRDFYAHMTTRTVADGARVAAGDRVGSVGAEGNVSGPHLHFERHTVASGPWSCYVVTDPQPSIDYADPDAKPPPPPEEPMPHYSRTKLTIALTPGPDWKSLPWDTVAAGDAGHEGAAYLTPGPGVFTATLTAKISKPYGSAPISTRWLEKEKQGDVWVDVETYPPLEHIVTSGDTFISDTRTQSLGKGRRLVAQVRLTDGGQILAAELNLASFQPA
jgi:murein DD-endopeptidase MepM/ murein hydrolase activator NlpD